MFNNLPAVVAKWSRGEFLTLNLSLFNTLLPCHNLMMLMLVIYIICNKAKNKMTDLKGNQSNKCFFEKTVKIETPPITLKTLSKGLLWKLSTLGGA